MKAICFIVKYMICSLIICYASPVMGQNIAYYSFIPNEAGDLDKAGFDIGYHSVFSQWDLNDDKHITDAEFFKVIFKRLDQNGDKSLSKKELTTGQTLWMDPNLNSGAFDPLKSNDDFKLNASQFEMAMKETGLFKFYDSNGDGKLTQKELNDMVYKLMDLDRNGFINKAEFDSVSKIYID